MKSSLILVGLSCLIGASALAKPPEPKRLNCIPEQVYFSKQGKNRVSGEALSFKVQLDLASGTEESESHSKKFEVETITFKNQATGKSCDYDHSEFLTAVWVNSSRAYLYTTLGSGETVTVVDPSTCKKISVISGDFFSVYRSKLLFHAACESIGPADDFKSCECWPAKVYVLSAPGCDPVFDSVASGRQTFADLGTSMTQGSKRKISCPKGWW